MLVFRGVYHQIKQYQDGEPQNIQDVILRRLQKDRYCAGCGTYIAINFFWHGYSSKVGYAKETHQTGSGSITHWSQCD